MLSIASPLLDWMLDYALLATAALLLWAVVTLRLSQPAWRQDLSRLTLVVLGCLAITTAIPGIPRLSLRTQETAPARPAPVSLNAGQDAFALIKSIPSQPTLPRSVAPRLEQPAPTHPKTSPPTQVAPPPWNWHAWIERIYIGIAILASLWLIIGAFCGMRLLRQSKPAPARVAKALRRLRQPRQSPLRVRMSPRLDHPLVMGIFRPTILLPGRFADEEPESSLRLALAHEWAHVRRADLAWLGATRALLPFLCLHPLFHLLRKRLRDDQELLADATASEAQGRLPYAEVLLQWARHSKPPGTWLRPASLALLERPSQLGQRIRVLVSEDQTVATRVSKGFSRTARVLCVFLAVGLSAVTFQPQLHSSTEPRKRTRKTPTRRTPARTSKSPVLSSTKPANRFRAPSCFCADRPESSNDKERRQTRKAGSLSLPRPKS